MNMLPPKQLVDPIVQGRSTLLRVAWLAWPLIFVARSIGENGEAGTSAPALFFYVNMFLQFCQGSLHFVQ